jgi:hypothetical protein
MSLPNELISAALGGGAAADTDYQIQRSLRFNSGDTAYLSRTPSSASNRRTWTWSGWVKLISLTGEVNFFNGGTSSSNDFTIKLRDGSLWVQEYSGLWAWRLRTDGLFRDPSAWYHLVVAFDSTQTTSTNRIKIYINGIQETSFTTAEYPSENFESLVNKTDPRYFGYSPAYNYSSFYLAETHFIDGQALAPTDFGEFDDSNVWQPKNVSIRSINNGTNWASSSYNAVTGTTGSTDMTNAFDGSLSTYTSLGSGDGSATSTVTFTPPSSITVTKSVRVYIGVDRGQSISVNGSQTNASVSAGWNDTGFTGTLSSLAIGPTNAGSSSNIAAIEINGEILISSYNNSSGYGTNGFHLDFSDNSNAPALGLNANEATTFNGVDFNNASYLLHAYNADFNFGTGSFTVETYVYLKSNTTIEGIYATSGGAGASPKIVFYIDNGTPKIHHNGFGSSTYLSATSTISTNTWTHLAFVRNGSSWSWYIDGTQSGTGSDSTNFTFTNQGTEIGQGGESYFSPFDGVISNLRVVKDAVYTSGFTAPSTPLSNISNTVLLCCQSSSSATAATVIPSNFTTSGTPIAGTFGNTSWTVGNLSAPPSNTGVYASNFVSSNGFNASYPSIRAFDGNTGTYAQASTTGGTLTFTPPSAISYSSSIKIYMPSAGATATINGGSAISVANSSETTIASGSGTLTSLVLAASNLPGLAYIKIDDQILVNTGLDSGTDSLVDTPTNYGDDTGAGGEVRGNYATFNPLSIKANQGTMENGNLTLKASGSYYIEGKSTIDVFSVDNYSELTVTSVSGIDSFAYGIGDIDAWVITGGGSYVVYRENGAIISYPGNTTLGTVSSYTQGDVLGMAVDSTNVKFYKNGTLQGTYAHGKSGTFFAMAMNVPNTGSAQLDINFGQREWAFSAPSGYKALCTQNLSEPTIADGSAYFDTKLYTGNGSTQTISGLSFSPDLTWVKGRSATQHHFYDTVRGAGEGKSLQSTTTNAEGSALDNATYGYLSAHTSDGFTVDAGSSPTYLNVNNINYVAWAWDAGANSSKTYNVTVVSDSGNKYRFDGHGTSAVTLDLEEGSTYTFDQSDSSNAGHPIRFSTTSDGTHGSGSEYTTGVVTSGTPGSAGAYTKITIASGAPTLYYYCSVHSGMGGQANTNSTAGATVLSGSLNDDLYDQSQNWTSFGTGTHWGTRSWANSFNGVIGTGPNDHTLPAAGQTMTWTPSSAITVNESVVIYGNNDTDNSTYGIKLNGGNFVLPANAGVYGAPVTILAAELSGSLTSIELISDASHNAPYLTAVKVDGKLLVDSSVSITTPSINSVVRANPAAGFSIVSVTEAAASGGSTVGHGLNAKPHMIIEKSRTGSTPWYIHNSELGDMSGSFLRFDTGTKQVDNAWNLVEPTSTTFGIDPTYVLGDANADVIYYLFTPVEGYSAIGSYTANALDDGPYVYTGFRPKWIMIKHATGTGSAYSSWIILDTERDTYNVSDASLLANRTSVEGTRGDGAGTAGPWMDILSNGFKIRYSWQVVNGTSGDKYIYMAFAENPFKTARAR